MTICIIMSEQGEISKPKTKDLKTKDKKNGNAEETNLAMKKKDTNDNRSKEENQNSKVTEIETK